MMVSHTTLVVLESVAKPTVEMVRIDRPMMLSTRGPYLSNRRPANGFMMPMRMAPGMITRPDTVAEYPM